MSARTILDGYIEALQILASQTGADRPEFERMADEKVRRLHIDNYRAEVLNAADAAPGADGLREWQLTRDNLNEIDDQIDADGIYAKGYWEFVDGSNVVTGLRIGTGEDRIVARFGDTIVRHADGSYSVRLADTARAEL